VESFNNPKPALAVKSVLSLFILSEVEVVEGKILIFGHLMYQITSSRKSPIVILSLPQANEESVRAAPRSGSTTQN